jgi:coproporphyrinogen III oxidase
MVVVHLFFRRCHGSGGGRWMMFQRGTCFSRGGIVILLLVGFFVQVCLTRMFVSCDDYMCNQQIV